MSMVASPRGPSCWVAVAALLFAIARAAAAQSSESPAPQAPPAESPPVMAPPPPAPAAAAAPAPQEPAQRKGRLYSWASVGTTFAYGQTYGSANAMKLSPDFVRNLPPPPAAMQTYCLPLTE